MCTDSVPFGRRYDPWRKYRRLGLPLWPGVLLGAAEVQMRREVRYWREVRQERLLLEHMVWHIRPWYQRTWLTLTLRRPEAL